MNRFFLLFFSTIIFRFSFAQHVHSDSTNTTKNGATATHSRNDLSGAFNKYAFTKDSIPQNAFVFYVIGDWGRKGKHGQTAVANAMDKCAHEAKPEFIISTGDNFYTFGVRNTKDKLWKKSFENIYNGDVLKGIVWYPVLGNHDHYGNQKAEIEYSKINPRWQMPSEYFAKQLSNATFVFTNTEMLVHQKNNAQWKFIDSTLAAANTKWKFVVGHHPVYSSNPTHGNTPVLIDKLKPILEKYNVHAYLAGHDHDLQHQQPKGSQIDYFVSGAGSELRMTDKNENTLFAKSENGFLVVALEENVAHYYFVNKDSNVIYSYTKAN